MSRNKILNNIQDTMDTKATESSNEFIEYKEDFIKMNVGSLKTIMKSAEAILSSLDDQTVKNNLTASWLQGKIAITEDYMRTIHDFVKYVPSDDDKSIAGCGCGKKKPKKTEAPKPQEKEQKQPNK
jgi:hypothetical protein